ncbi:hypothetical protein FA13DRAFT_1838143 [Coprinellus micaceus]|uniref:Uncharacterized protein n=1 Tax=Coprinellus micaceus TaxID=71717 RepID=A0A4Y7TH53_COPMI|nr:hypothetical protein FA13DRAFT_1838143 [Coprinellus micaceus]
MASGFDTPGLAGRQRESPPLSSFSSYISFPYRLRRSCLALAFPRGWRWSPAGGVARTLRMREVVGSNPTVSIFLLLHIVNLWGAFGGDPDRPESRSHEASCLFSFRPPSLRALKLVWEPLPPFQFNFLDISDAKATQTGYFKQQERHVINSLWTGGRDREGNPSNISRKDHIESPRIVTITTPDWTPVTVHWLPSAFTSSSHLYRSTKRLAIHMCQSSAFSLLHMRRTIGIRHSPCMMRPSVPSTGLSSTPAPALAIPRTRTCTCIGRTIVRRDQTPSGAGLASAPTPASAFAVPSYEETICVQAQHLPYHRTKRPDALMRWFSFRYRYSRTIVRRDQMRSCAGLASTTATPVPTALMQWSSTSSHYPISRSGIHIHGGQSRPNSRLTFAAPIHRVASPSVPGTARRFRALLEVPPARPLLREVAHCPGPD